MIGLIAATAAGRRQAGRLAELWPDARSYDGPAGEAIRHAWTECAALVCFLATGATVRLAAPLLTDKHTDPGVVCVDEAGRYAVALLGGHAGGANALAERVATSLGASAVLTTASDAAGIAGLDLLGWPVEGAVAAVTRAMLDGEPVALRADATYPLPALPVGDHGEHVLAVTDRVVAMDGRTAVLRPPTLVLGLGASRGVSAEELLDLVDAALAQADLSARSIAGAATIEAKRDEAGLIEAAARRGWPLRCYPAEQLARVAVPNPSEVVRAAVGTPSVAEAAALADGGALVGSKQRSAMATVAIARRRLRGRLALVGIGPGARDLLTPRAVAELRRASVVVGLDSYVQQVRDLLRPGTRVLASGIGAEERRASTAVAQARQGHAVALIGSGDVGVYALAAPALELLGVKESAAEDHDVEVVAVPGVTAALAAAALLGAPLGHDHAAISLSDLTTPWPAIEARVEAVARGDLVVTFYNPRSRDRDWQLPRALEILRAHRPSETPVGVVRDASRPGERVSVTTLAKLDVATVDMRTIVIVGSSQSRVVGGRMITPRGYRWAP